MYVLTYDTAAKGKTHIITYIYTYIYILCDSKLQTQVPWYPYLGL